MSGELKKALENAENTYYKESENLENMTPEYASIFINDYLGCKTECSITEEQQERFKEILRTFSKKFRKMF